jgi:hypothetical protein
MLQDFQQCYFLPEMKRKERKVGKGISFTPTLLLAAEQRAVAAGFANFSDYIVNLIEGDLGSPHDAAAPRADEVAYTSQEIG